MHSRPVSYSKMKQSRLSMHSSFDRLSRAGHSGRTTGWQQDECDAQQAELAKSSQNGQHCQQTGDVVDVQQGQLQCCSEHLQQGHQGNCRCSSDLSGCDTMLASQSPAVQLDIATAGEIFAHPGVACASYFQQLSTHSTVHLQAGILGACLMCCNPC